MAHLVKNENSPSNDGCLNKGNISIVVRNGDHGPTSTTGLYQGTPPDDGGYTVYVKDGSNPPRMHTASDDDGFLSIINDLGGDADSVTDALLWASQQSDVLVINDEELSNVVTDNLKLNAEVRSVASYPRTENTWYDLSGRGNDITLINNPTFNSDSLNFDFNGSNEYAQLSSNTDFLNNKRQFTWEFWVQLDSKPSSDLFLVSYTKAGSNDFFINYKNNQLKVGINGTEYSKGFTYTQSELTQIVVTVDTDNDTIKMYRNAVLVATVDNATAVIPDGSYRAITLFADDDGGTNFNQFMDGKCSKVRFYSKVLSADEVMQNYGSENIFPNGDFRAGTNKNFSHKGTLTTTHKLDNHSHGLQLPNERGTSFLGSEYVKVDRSKDYTYSLWIKTITKGGNDGTVLYGGHQGMACYDKNKQFIDNRHTGGYANMKLTRDLNAGDSHAYVEMANGFASSRLTQDVNSNSWVFRHFMVFPKDHPDYGLEWQYTRIGMGDFNIIYDNQNVEDLGGGEFKVPFVTTGGTATTFPDIGYSTPIGTAIDRGVAGGTYQYLYYPGYGGDGTFTKYTRTMNRHTMANNRQSGAHFRPATEYVRFMHLINYSSPSGQPNPIGCIGRVELKEKI